MYEGHLPVLVEEVLEMLAPAPAAFTSTPPLAAVGTPSGFWRRPILTAASLDSTPTLPRSLESSSTPPAIR